MEMPQKTEEQKADCCQTKIFGTQYFCMIEKNSHVMHSNLVKARELTQMTLSKFAQGTTALHHERRSKNTHRRITARVC